MRAGQWTATATLALLFFFQVLFPTPGAVLLLGVILGSLNALVAVGLVLVYRANRIVSFAQGDLGAIGAILTVSLVAGPGWPFLLALIVGLTAAALMGAAVEVVVIRRFATAPRLILTVATVGVAQVLAFGQLAVPSLFGFNIAPQDFPTPFDFSFEWHPVVFRGSHLLVLLVVPVAAAALIAFLRYSRFGLAMKAAADSSDRSLLLGIPVRRVHTIVWTIAALLSGVAATLRVPIVGVSIGTVLGPALLLRALAAAVIGRMEHLGVTVAAAVMLGVVEQAVFFDTGRTLLTDAVLFLVITTTLLVQRGRRSRAEDAQASTWTAIAEPPPIPRHLRDVPAVRWGGTVGRAALVIAAVLAPFVFDAAGVNLLGVGLIRAMVGLSLLVLIGWAGEISLGQIALFGFGAAAAGKAAESGVGILPALVFAGLVGAAAALVIGLPALRIRGPFLAVTTLAFALATSSYFLNPDFFPGWLPSSRLERPVLFGRFDLEADRTYYYFLLVLLALMLVSLRSIRTSRTGRAMIALRENARAAQAVGINEVRNRLVAFALSGFFAALAGGAFVFHQRVLGGSSYLPEESLRLFGIVVIGGLGSVAGVLSGVAFFTGLDYFSPAPELRLFATGAGMLVVLLFFRGGIGQVLLTVRDRHLLPRLARGRFADELAEPGTSPPDRMAG